MKFHGNSVGMAVEDQLFSLLREGRNDAAFDLLEILRLQASNHVIDQNETADELCLPLRLALDGFRHWVTRAKLLSTRDSMSLCLQQSYRRCHIIDNYLDKSQMDQKFICRVSPRFPDPTL